MFPVVPPAVCVRAQVEAFSDQLAIDFIFTCGCSCDVCVYAEKSLLCESVHLQCYHYSIDACWCDVHRAEVLTAGCTGHG